MDKLYIEGNDTTPTINFNLDKGRFEIAGPTIEEAQNDALKEASSWLSRYWTLPSVRLEVHIKLKNACDIAVKRIEEILEMLAAQLQEGKRILVIWHTDGNRNMLNIGEAIRRKAKLEVKVLEA